MSRWEHKEQRRYRCVRCCRWFIRTIIVDPLMDWRDKLDPHYCGRRDCAAKLTPGLFDIIENYSANQKQNRRPPP